MQRKELPSNRPRKGSLPPELSLLTPIRREQLGSRRLQRCVQQQKLQRFSGREAGAGTGACTEVMPGEPGAAQTAQAKKRGRGS